MGGRRRVDGRLEESRGEVGESKIRSFSFTIKVKFAMITRLKRN